MLALNTPSRPEGARARRWIGRLRDRMPRSVGIERTMRAGFRHRHRARPGSRRHRHAVVPSGRGHSCRANCGDSLAQMSARERIEARGLIVAPGFIDMLGQSELTLLVNPHVPSKLYHGITTEITGEGDSVAPLDERVRATDWSSIDRK